MTMPPPGSEPRPPQQPPPWGSTPPPPPPPGAAVPPGYQPYTPHQPPPFGEVAGFGVRLGGYLLDGLLYGLLYVVFMIPGVALVLSAFEDCVTVGGTTTCTDVSGGPTAAGLALIVVGAILVFALYVSQLGRTGQTWGRRIVGIRVLLDTTGEPIGLGKAIGRTLFEGFISGQIFYLGYLWMLWDDKKQTWHDKIVGSNVYRV